MATMLRLSLGPPSMMPLLMPLLLLCWGHDTDVAVRVPVGAEGRLRRRRRELQPPPQGVDFAAVRKWKRSP